MRHIGYDPSVVLEQPAPWSTCYTVRLGRLVIEGSLGVVKVCPRIAGPTKHPAPLAAIFNDVTPNNGLHETFVPFKFQIDFAVGGHPLDLSLIECSRVWVHC